MNCQRRGIRLKFCESDCMTFENEQLQKTEQIKKVRQQEEQEQKKQREVELWLQEKRLKAEQLWMEELMKEKFLLQEQLSDEKVRVKNMQMKLTEVESALSDWKQKYSEMQREYRAYVAKVEANGFKYLMINLKKWIKNNYLLLLLVALAVWVIYLLYQLFFMLF